MSRKVALALAVVTGAAGTAVPARAAGEVPRCRVMDLSPAFDRDGTGFCAYLVSGASADSYGVVRLLRTTNRGQSWQRVAAAGLDRIPLGGSGQDVDQIVVSPRFPQDRQVLVQLQSGTVFLSQDAGASFLPLDPVAQTIPWASVFWNVVTPPSITAYHEPAGPVTGASAAYAHAGPVAHRILTAPTTAVVPVPPAGATDEVDQDEVVFGGRGVLPVQFLTAPTTGPVRHRFLVGTTVGFAGQFRPHLYACDANFLCAERLHTFARGGAPARTWIAPDFERSRAMFAWHIVDQGMLPPAVSPPPGSAVYWSHDGGRTFARWPSVGQLIHTLYHPPLAKGTLCAAIGIPRVGLSFDRGRYYLRLSGWVAGPGGPCTPAPSPPAPPGDGIYESADQGKTWKLLAAGLAVRQPGRRGSIPWDQLGGPLSMRGDLTVRAGRIFVIAKLNDYEGVFCSVDNGRSWAPTCRR